ncbi:hypothetical protein STCU_09260 [Strigomonas culicis]|nr:hypothetical protein STCU_09260 [Strigomonas culicis]|eukprot:EPY19862.1 hypothetical protein STCU_09260 [Strigomonas culicis]
MDDSATGPHKTAAASPRISTSFEGSVPSPDARPRISVTEASAYFNLVFNPQVGQLECMLTGFVTVGTYQVIGGFFSSFLDTELRDKWFIDYVMLGVLGRDRWRSMRHKDLADNSVNGKEVMRQMMAQRQEHTDLLRERLLVLSGVVAPVQPRNRHQSLQALLNEYRHGHAEDDTSVSSLMPTEDPDATALTRMKMKRMTPSEEMSHGDLHNTMEPDGLYVSRLRNTVGTSFDCFHLIAKRIPRATITAEFSDYFTNTVPIMDERISFQERILGEAERLSFFVSLHDRARLIQGLSVLAPNDPDGPRQTMRETGLFDTQERITQASDVYSAVRNLGMVVTTATSSLVLYVLFHLAEVIRIRSRFRELCKEAKEKNVSLESLVGPELATVKHFLGNAGDNMQDWKRFVIQDEMTLPVFTQLLITRFRKDNKSKIDYLRKKYFDIFNCLELSAPAAERRDIDPMRLLSGIALKLMYLLGGGQRSIQADDRRLPFGSRTSRDDVWVMHMLEVPILNRICWFAYMMGMPVMSAKNNIVTHEITKPLSFIQIDECTGVMRELFQAVGALPCGEACPRKFSEWMQLFPFYAVNAEGKRTLTYLYVAQKSAVVTMPVKVQKDVALVTLANAIREKKKNFDVINYLFDPKFSIGGVSGNKSDTRANNSGSGNANRRRSTLPSNDSSDSSDESYNSVLFSDDEPIDIYTCVSPQAQLYLRCANEATVRRHKASVLTPFCTTEFYHSSKEVIAQRPDVANTLLRLVPKFLPDEAVLFLKWNRAPTATLQPGDYLNLLVERLNVAGSVTAGPSAPPSHFNGKMREGSSQALYSTSSLLIGDGADKSLASFAGGDRTNKAFNRMMGTILGEEEQLAKRVNVTWTIQHIYLAKHLQSGRRHSGDDRNGRADGSGEEYVLHVKSLDMPLTEPLRICSIGHQRATMSAFTYVGDDRAICWTNPSLISAIYGITDHQNLLQEGSNKGEERQRLLSTAICHNEEELHALFYAVGIMLANSIANGVFGGIPVAPLAFHLFKKAISSGDYDFRTFMWLEPCDGNLLSSAHVVNSAFSVLAMTDNEYYLFLRSRKLDNPEHLVFPVQRSMATEQQEDNLNAQSADGAGGPRESSESFASRSDADVRRRSSVHNYIGTIQNHNRRGSMFSGNSITSKPTPNGTANFSSSGALSNDSVSALLPADTTALLAHLPSREEYISLYLVNDLVWGSVQRDGLGARNKNLWVSMMKGFLSSPVSKSPLMCCCCSRIIREVLCVPEEN